MLSSYNVTQRCWRNFESNTAELIILILLQNKVLDDAQEVFRKGRGTSRMLYKIFANNQIKCPQQNAILIGIDLEKAFDSVYINLMTIKFIQSGVVGKLAGFVHDYLSNRKVQIQIDAIISDPFSCNLGLPQGSILSPLLFLIFVVDIVDQSICYQYKYADDTKLLVESDCPSKCLDEATQAMNKFQTWCSENRIKINVDKTVFLPINFTEEEYNAVRLFLRNYESS